MTRLLALSSIRYLVRAAFCALAAGLLLGSAGCVVLGALAAKATPAPTVPRAYDGLTGKTTAVWVWVDPAVDLDYPRLSLDIASRVQGNLVSARDEGSSRQKRELAGTTFPIQPESVVKHQKRDPMLNLAPIEQVAPRLDVERLIYIEVPRFTTQGGAAAGLYRGMATVNVSVIEIDPQTKRTRVGYREQGLSLAFPPTGPTEGSSSLNQRTAYQGLTLQIADQAALRFLTHSAEEQRS